MLVKMDSTLAGGSHYVVTVGPDGKMMQPLQEVTIKNDNLYQYIVSSATGSGHHVPIVTIGPNGKLIPVRERLQNSNSSEIAATQNQGMLDVKGSMKTEAQEPDDIDGQENEEESQASQLHQQVLRPDKIVKGEREVECAKSCRACCNIDEPADGADANFSNRKESTHGNSSAPRSWSSGRNSDSSTEADSARPCSSGSTPQEKLPNNFPLVLGLMPAANQKPEPLPKGRFQCKVCFKLFTQKVNLTTHERIHLGERPYQCKVCSKAFTQQSNLVTHERIHTGERPYECQVCTKRFTQRQNLTAHERIHLGERPFQCQVCQKAFTQRQNLVAHERIHLGERPYQCQVCSKSFTQQQNLTAHERIHSGDRHYVCPVCQKSFTQEQNLSKHILTHTGEKPYSCQFCNKSFTQQSNLTTHKRSHLVANPAGFEGPGGKRSKVYVYTQEQLLSAHLQSVEAETNSEDVPDGVPDSVPDGGVTPADTPPLSSLFPATRQQ